MANVERVPVKGAVERACYECGAPAGRRVHGPGWRCLHCGRWQDSADCPVCGSRNLGRQQVADGVARFLADQEGG
jgi:DNA-directed RNA polymerase subunit RPC12/RpoP